MDSFQTELMNNIKNSIDNAITQLAASINEKYPEIATEDIEKLWGTVSNQKLTSPIKTKKLDINSSNTCPYIFQKGKEGVKGCVCGAKSVKEKEYCSRHSKYEGTVREEKKLMPTPKSKKSDTETKQISPVQKSFDRLLFKHKGTGRLWHPSTCLVFHSAENRTVIGKILNDNITDLTEQDIDTCKKLGFGFSSNKNNDINLSEKKESMQKNADSDSDNQTKESIKQKLPTKKKSPTKKDSDSDTDNQTKESIKKKSPTKKDSDSDSETKLPTKKDSDSDSDRDSDNQTKESIKQKLPTKKLPIKKDSDSKTKKSIKKDSDSEDENSKECNSNESIKNFIPKALGIKNRKIVDESDSDSDIELDSGEE